MILIYHYMYIVLRSNIKKNRATVNDVGYNFVNGKTLFLALIVIVHLHVVCSLH